MKLVDAYLTAYNAQDSNGCARTFTPDGALFSPFGPPASGRAAIAAAHSQWFAEVEEDKRLEVQEFHDEGKSGYCLLGWSARVPDENEAGGFRVESGVSLGILTVSSGDVFFHRMALVPDAV